MVHLPPNGTFGFDPQPCVKHSVGAVSFACGKVIALRGLNGFQWPRIDTSH